MSQENLDRFMANIRKTNKGFRKAASSLKGLLDYLEQTKTAPKPLEDDYEALAKCGDSNDPRLRKYRWAIELLVKAWGKPVGAPLENASSSSSSSSPADLFTPSRPVLDVKGTPPPYRGVKQRYAVYSEGPPIGTTGLMNCLGIVIYNQAGQCGIVAHVEAAAAADYPAVVDGALETMMQTLNKGKARGGDLSVVLLGNAAGGDDLTKRLGESVTKHVTRLRQNTPDFQDLRTNRGSNVHGAQSSVYKGKWGGCVLDPKNGILWIAYFLPPGDESNVNGVSQFDIQ